jgi:hypothetical protein
VGSEIRHQAFERALAAVDPHRLRYAHRRFEHSLRHLLGQDIVDTDVKPQWPLRGSMVEGVEELAPGVEDLFREFEHHAAHFGGDQLAARLHQQLLAQAFFERAQLRAHRRRR